MYLFLLDEHAKLRKIAGIIKANTFGRKEVFLRFPEWNRMFSLCETYGSASGNVGFMEWKRRKCAEACWILYHKFRKTIC